MVTHTRHLGRLGTLHRCILHQKVRRPPNVVTSYHGSVCESIDVLQTYRSYLRHTAASGFHCLRQPGESAGCSGDTAGSVVPLGRCKHSVVRQMVFASLHVTTQTLHSVCQLAQLVGTIFRMKLFGGTGDCYGGSFALCMTSVPCCG